MDANRRKKFNEDTLKKRRVYVDKLKLFMDTLNFHISEYNLDPFVRALHDDLQNLNRPDLAKQLNDVFNNGQDGTSTETDVTNIDNESPGTLGMHAKCINPDRENARLDFLQSLLSSNEFGTQGRAGIKTAAKEIVSVINKGLALHKIKRQFPKIGIKLFYF
jgi:hypothetical protein